MKLGTYRIAQMVSAHLAAASSKIGAPEPLDRWTDHSTLRPQALRSTLLTEVQPKGSRPHARHLPSRA